MIKIEHRCKPFEGIVARQADGFVLNFVRAAHFFGGPNSTVAELSSKHLNTHDGEDKPKY